MEKEAYDAFYRREGRCPTVEELEAELARRYPPQFRRPPFHSTCPACGRPMDETFNLNTLADADDDIPF